MNSIEPYVAHKIYVTSSLILAQVMDSKLSSVLSVNETIIVVVILFVLFDTTKRMLRTKDQNNRLHDNEFARLMFFLQQISILFISLQLRKILLIKSDSLRFTFLADFLVAIATAITVHMFREETSNIITNIIYIYADIFNFLIPMCGPFPCILFATVVVQIGNEIQERKKISFVLSFLLDLCTTAAQSIIFTAFDMMAKDSVEMEILQSIMMVALLRFIMPIDYFVYVSSVKIYMLTHELVWIAFVLSICFIDKKGWFFQITCNYIQLFVASFIQRFDIIGIPCVVLLFFYIDDITRGVFSKSRRT